MNHLVPIICCIVKSLVSITAAFSKIDVFPHIFELLELWREILALLRVYVNHIQFKISTLYSFEYVLILHVQRDWCWQILQSLLSLSAEDPPYSVIRFCLWVSKNNYLLPKATDQYIPDNATIIQSHFNADNLIYSTFCITIQCERHYKCFTSATPF